MIQRHARLRLRLHLRREMSWVLRWRLLSQSRVDHVLIGALEREKAISLRREELIWLVILPKIVRDFGRIAGVQEKVRWRSWN